jgi:dTDP-4-amino-4,6-dideoxygalactose transaminase
VDELEKRFAEKMGAKYALAVTSGTAALVTAYTWIATAAAVVSVGAIPVVAEVDESLTLDPADLPNRLSPFTRAIIPVHMRGVPCRMDEIMAFARVHNLKIIEDAANQPWASAPRPVDYSPAACPRTLDLLSRAVHVDVNPLYSSADIESVAEAIENALKVEC